MVFNAMPLKYIKAKVAITDTGIAIPIIIVLEMLRKNTRRIRTANAEPRIAELFTLFIDVLNESALSLVIVIATPAISPDAAHPAGLRCLPRRASEPHCLFNTVCTAGVPLYA